MIRSLPRRRPMRARTIGIPIALLLITFSAGCFGTGDSALLAPPQPHSGETKTGGTTPGDPGTLLPPSNGTYIMAKKSRVNQSGGDCS